MDNNAFRHTIFPGPALKAFLVCVGALYCAYQWVGNVWTRLCVGDDRMRPILVSRSVIRSREAKVRTRRFNGWSSIAGGWVVDTFLDVLSTWRSNTESVKALVSPRWPDYAVDRYSYRGKTICTVKKMAEGASATEPMWVVQRREEANEEDVLLSRYNRSIVGMMRQYYNVAPFFSVFAPSFTIAETEREGEFEGGTMTARDALVVMRVLGYASDACIRDVLAGNVVDIELLALDTLESRVFNIDHLATSVSLSPSSKIDDERKKRGEEEDVMILTGEDR